MGSLSCLCVNFDIFLDLLHISGVNRVFLWNFITHILAGSLYICVHRRKNIGNRKTIAGRRSFGVDCPTITIGLGRVKDPWSGIIGTRPVSVDGPTTRSAIFVALKSLKWH